VLRTIVGFHQDDDGDWVAHLSCRHRQHVRHRPPFFDREWVTTAAGRSSRLGAEIDCPLCDRAELPEGLEVVRSAGPFDADTLPPGLRRDHRVADGVWGRLRVTHGSARFVMDTEPPIDRVLRAGQAQAIPPGVAHRVVVDEAVQLQVDFLQPGLAPGA
jgi:tellurite resistance-related uncharacterized protein